MNNVKVKICGLKDEAALQAIVSAGTDYAGFVYFPPSPRHVTLPRAAELKARLPKSVKAVSVLVDPDDALLAQVSEILKPDAVQLHGKETPERLAAIRALLPDCLLIKAITVKTSDDVAAANRYMGTADMLLFDARPPQLLGILPGGNGLSFDWALLKNRDFGKPWFLSGGLSPENVADAITASGARMVDVSSSLESAPGVKDTARINAFVKAARNA